jgi:hypothetical protein
MVSFSGDVHGFLHRLAVILPIVSEGGSRFFGENCNDNHWLDRDN